MSHSAPPPPPPSRSLTHFISCLPLFSPSHSTLASFFALHQSFATGCVPSAFDIFRLKRTCENSVFIVPLWLIIQTPALVVRSGRLPGGIARHKAGPTRCEESGIWDPSFRFCSAPVRKWQYDTRTGRSYCQSSSYPLTSVPELSLEATTATWV